MASIKPIVLTLFGMCPVMLVFLLCIERFLHCAGRHINDSIELNPEPAIHRLQWIGNVTRIGNVTNLSRDTIYVITPTYRRHNQKPLLISLAQTFSLIKGLHWIVVEDSPHITPWIRETLTRLISNFTLLACDSGKYCKSNSGCKNTSGKRTIARNCGLLWLKESGFKDGIIYFADDDNFYDVRLFDELQNTKTVSLFPVGGFLDTGVSSPVMVNGHIKDFIHPWKVDRKWPIDMAGFAVRLPTWEKQGFPLFHHTKGHVESQFLSDLRVEREKLQVLGKAKMLN